MWQEPCQLPIKGERSGIKGEIFGSSIEEIFPVFSDVGALTSLAGVCHMFMGALKAWRNCVFWSIEGLFSPIEPGAPLPEGGWSSGLSVLGERASLEAAGRSRPEGEGRSRLEVSNVVGRSAQSGTSELQRSDLASNLWIDAAFNTLRNRCGRTRHGCIVHASSYGCAKCLFWEKQNLRLIDRTMKNMKSITKAKGLKRGGRANIQIRKHFSCSDPQRKQIKSSLAAGL